MSTTETLFAAGPAETDTRSVIQSENWKLLRYFNAYRLALSGLASALAVSKLDVAPFGSQSPALFLAAALLYFAVSVLAVALIHRRPGDFEVSASALAFIDIALLTLLMHASGGLSSGLGLLLIVAVAGNGFMLAPRMSVFLAAIATLAVLIENSWGFLVHEPLASENYPQVGMFGVALFATAAISYFLSDRLRATEALAQSRGADLVDLEQINDMIVQRMHAGVMVIGASGDIRTVNKMARSFLALDDLPEGTTLMTAAADLAREVDDWRRNPSGHKRKLLRTSSGYVLLPRFMPVGAHTDSGVVIFLEDTSILRQQAQQLKMAALARLTASIAHEIRNPLGAISNASQLLGESLAASDQNRRLLRIIEDQGRRMNVIVENVLQLGRRDRVRLVRTDLRAWLERFVSRYCDTIGLPRAAIQLRAEDGLTVCVDPDQLDQVVSNLCQNALRHSPPFSGEPLIDLTAARLPETRVYLDVVDRGSGVPAEIADNIFDPFFTTTPRGTGLGLYIAKELCEGNGGRLEYQAGEPVGSRFRVTFSKNEECVGFDL